MGLDAPLSALDAATGGEIRKYEGTRVTEEVLCSEGVLFVLVNPLPGKMDKIAEWRRKPRRILAVKADTGKQLWSHRSPVAPITLCADRRAVYFYDGKSVVCLDRSDGKRKWRSKPVSSVKRMPTCFGPRLLVSGDVLVFAGGDRSMTALSATDGKKLWSGKHPESGHHSLEDLMVIDGLVWSGATAVPRQSGIFSGRDLKSGEVKVEFPPDVKTHWFHQRCHPNKATTRYLLISRTGVEFVDFRKKHWQCHHWVRGGCIYGIMPCNGLLYAPPHACACYLESKLNGFCALSGAAVAKPDPKAPRLEKGPAYDRVSGSAFRVPGGGSWPTYRHDVARSGTASAAVGGEPKKSWTAEIGGRLSSVTAAGGLAFVAEVDAHAVHALDAKSGERRWTFTTGGRVDGPPTIHNRFCVFGCADGHLYCLSAADGKLVWRFRVAPEDRRIVVRGQLESAWPLHGSVLVLDGVAYVVAGRSMFVDGGLRFARVEVATGRLVGERVLDESDPETEKNLQVKVRGLNMPVALPDVLSFDGKSIYMRSQVMDLEGKRRDLGPRAAKEQGGETAHLFCPTGFLDDAWFHRSYWLFGRTFLCGAGGYYYAGRYVPSGQILSFDKEKVYGFGRKPEYYCWTSKLEYQLFSADRKAVDEAIARANRFNREVIAEEKQKFKQGRRRSKWFEGGGRPWQRKIFKTKPALEKYCATSFRWRRAPEVMARAMVLAGDRLLVAGKSGEGFKLAAVSTADGKTSWSRELGARPVFDGMAAAAGRLFVSLENGRVVCFASSAAKGGGQPAR
jgi:outer membrane protein assembly factor BamB